MRWIPLSLLLLSSAALAQSPKSVVVSFQPYHTLVNNIAGGKVQVTLLLPPGVSPHTFDPKPSDIRKVTGAGLAFLNGAGIDDWLGDLVKNSGSKARQVRFAERLRYPKLAPLESEVGGEAHEEHHEHAEAADPHIWLDASIMAGAARLIGEELARYDAPNAALYRKNAALEVQKLSTLHAELKRDLAPVRNARIVTFHGAWTYFSKAYGPKVVAAIEPFPGKEPSARYIADTVRLIRAQKVRAVFSEPTLPETSARAIAENAGAKLYVLTPEGSAQVKDYYEMMRQNKKTLLAALR